jgi:fumarate reductase subunit C
MCNAMTTCQSYTSTPKEKFVNYSCCTCSWWQKLHSSSWLILREMTYTIVVSVPIENIVVNSMRDDLRNRG